MTHPVDDPNERRWLQLSALCDGEADAAEAQASFDAWREEAGLRQRWHAYQWIGDVMRSDDLASDVEHDQGFLLALRARLAEEPVVLAPVRQPSFAPAADDAALATVTAAGARRARWGVPVAMAAGVMVTGALVMGNLTSSRQAEVATLPLAVAGPGPVAASASGRDPAGPVEIGAMVRDPELDRYLNAHRQFVGSTSLAVPGGVRQVAVVQDGR